MIVTMVVGLGVVLGDTVYAIPRTSHTSYFVGEINARKCLTAMFAGVAL